MSLNPRQERFVEEYIKDPNATQAAIRAGYSPKTAQEQSSRLLSNVMISEAIKAKRLKISEKVELSQEWVLEKLKLIVDRTTKDDTFDPKGANKALELIGKHIGMFSDKLKITPDERITVQIVRPVRQTEEDEDD